MGVVMQRAHYRIVRLDGRVNERIRDGGSSSALAPPIELLSLHTIFLHLQAATQRTQHAFSASNNKSSV